MRAIMLTRLLLPKSLPNIIVGAQSKLDLHVSSVLQKFNDLPKEPTNWINYNRTIYPPASSPNDDARNAVTPVSIISSILGGTSMLVLITTQFFHHMKAFVRGNTKKYWYAAQMVRGMSVDEAIKQLSFYKTQEGHVIRQTIEEAIELAVKKECFEFRSNMWISASHVGRALIIKGVRQHMRGPMFIERHRYSHYFLRLEEGKPPKHFYNPLPRLSNRIDEHVRVVEDRQITHSL